MNMTPPADLGFVVGLYNAEDIAPIPGSRWMVTSGMAGPEHPQGHLYLVDTAAKTSEELFPSQVEIRESSEPYDDVPPPDVEKLNAHGLALRPGENGRHLLYLVNHGQREAIEVFEIDATADRPAVAWIGAIMQAPTVWGNAVAALPEGGIVATNYLDLTDSTAFDRVYAGKVTGSLMEWQAGEGWHEVPHSTFSAPNGVEVSPDGRWFFVASWATKSFVRLSRGASPVRRDTIQLDFLADNVKWSNGRLFTAGQISDPKTVFDGVTSQASCNFAVAAVAVDPETLEVEELARFEHPVFGTAATILPINGELWISSAANDRIAYIG